MLKCSCIILVKYVCARIDHLLFSLVNKKDYNAFMCCLYECANAYVTLTTSLA